MAKFLNTTGVSYHLEELIKGTKDRLILISPYLQFNERIKEHLSNLNIQKRDIRIIYREDKLQSNDNNWLVNQIGIRTSVCKNLHAKCYLNEKEAIITSMNLYEFSQQNNNEMGIHISKMHDKELYDEAFEESQRLLRISEEIKVMLHNNFPTNEKYNQPKISSKNNWEKPHYGFCIMTGKKIPFNKDRPMSEEIYNSDNQNGRIIEYDGKYCHFSGEKSYGETKRGFPIMNKNWSKAKKMFNLQ